tara:strand:+ start:1863 stop:2636 length:774 start_codon:yes stop_codon:yes gene_type:complete
MWTDRGIGNRTQQTVNCDFIHVSRTGTFQNIDVGTINHKTLSQIISDVTGESVQSELTNIKRDLDNIRKEIRDIRRNSGPVGYKAGRTVTLIIHFEDVDVNTPNFDNSHFQEELFTIFSDTAKINSDHIIIICIKENNGSSIVELELQYHFSNNTAEQTIIEENLSNFVHMLNSNNVSMLSKFGDANILSFSVGPIEGINCKIAKIKNKFKKEEISFEESDTLILGEFRLKIKNNQLFIQRYDHYIGEYVGGTIVTD